MLYQFGPVQFDVWPFNAHEVRRETIYDFAEHPVVGAMPPLEQVGPGVDRFVLLGRLFPQKLGGLPNLAALRLVAEAQAGQPLMRGDGVPIGWYVITSLNVGETYLDVRGIGRVIEFEASFRAASKPSATSWLSGLVSLFG